MVFLCHPSNFKVTRDKILPILTRIEHFHTVTPVWIRWWLWTDAQSLMYYRRGARLCFFRSFIKFQGHTGWKIDYLNPIWVRLLGWSQLSNPSDLPCFQGHPSNFKVTRDKTSPILTQFGHFRTIGRSQLSNPSDLPFFFFYDFWFWIWLRKASRAYWN